jgi:hypothetical protein
MSKFRLVNVLIFATCLIWGFKLGSRLPITGSKEAAEKQVMSQQLLIPTLNNGQRNILLISVDSINKASAKLQGIWLVTYYTTSSTINLWPVYPTTNNGEVYYDNDLVKAFHLTFDADTPRIDPKFIRALEAKKFWWSGYLIFDEYATTEVLNLLNEVPDRAQSSTDLRGISNPLLVGLNVQSSFQQQMSWLDVSCRTLLSQNNHPVWDKFLSLIPDHISSDLDTSLILSEWQLLTDNPGVLTCKFPLSTQAP